jgi:hypothetical protein
MKNIVKEMETVFVLNGKEVDATITISTEHDEDFDLSDIDFENDQDKTRFERKLARNELEPVYILVEISALGETESDSLGRCFVTSPEDLDSYVSDHNMIEDATNSLTELLKAKYETLKPFFEEGV